MLFLVLVAASCQGKAGPVFVTADAGVPTDLAAATIWRPMPGVSWQIQLTGTVDTSFAVDMYDVDLFSPPDAIFEQLRAAGRIIVCYISVGTWEPWRPDADQFPPEVLGSDLIEYPDERWLDVRDSRVRALMVARLSLARSRGCSAVHLSTTHGYTTTSGFPLTAADYEDFIGFLAGEAHQRSLSAGSGSTRDVAFALRLVPLVEWTLGDDCVQRDECAGLKPFAEASKAAFVMEYGGAERLPEVCPIAARQRLDVVVKARDLGAFRLGCP